jgi:hypothetical protein
MQTGELLEAVAAGGWFTVTLSVQVLEQAPLVMVRESCRGGEPLPAL